MMDVEKKRNDEKEILSKMVHIYCRSQRHGEQKGTLCAGCRELLEYAKQRADACTRVEEKVFCSKCPIRCYKPEMRERIRAVMRYAGPRMLWHTPILVLKHIKSTVKTRLI